MFAVWSDFGIANVGGTLDVSATLIMTTVANFFVIPRINRFFCGLTSSSVSLLFSIMQSLIATDSSRGHLQTRAIISTYFDINHANCYVTSDAPLRSTFQMTLNH